MAQIISDDLKSAREKAVTGMKGSRHITVFLVSLYQTASLCLRDSLVNLLISVNGTVHKNVLALMDYIVIVIPNILICIYIDYSLGILIGTFILAMLLRLMTKKSLIPWKSSYIPYELIRRKRLAKVSVPFINQANSLLLIATSISILFVDFLVYPRCLVKTETYGVSVMDVGTGAILFISGISYGLLEGTFN